MDAHFSNSLKKSMLESDLQGLKCFREIRFSEGIDMARGKDELSYEEYVSTAHNTAVTHDLSESRFRMRRQPMRAVRRAETTRQNRSERYEDQEQWELYDDDDELYFVDEENENIEVHYVGQERKSCIEKEAWQKLSQEDKRVWGRLSREGRVIILNQAQENNTQKREDRTINATESSSDNNNVEKDLTPSYSDPNSLLGNLKKGRDVPPSDIRKVMAETDMRRSNRECNTSRYTVTLAHIKVKPGALVDRGANGGLAGSDV